MRPQLNLKGNSLKKFLAVSGIVILASFGLASPATASEDVTAPLITAPIVALNAELSYPEVTVQTFSAAEVAAEFEVPEVVLEAVVEPAPVEQVNPNPIVEPAPAEQVNPNPVVEPVPPVVEEVAVVDEPVANNGNAECQTRDSIQYSDGSCIFLDATVEPVPVDEPGYYNGNPACLAETVVEVYEDGSCLAHENGEDKIIEPQGVQTAP